MRITRFEFDRGISMNDATLTLVLARLSAEGLVGAARVRLEVQHEVDPVGNAIVVSGVGESFDAVIRIFTALLGREFGEEAFTARPVEVIPPRLAAASV